MGKSIKSKDKSDSIDEKLREVYEEVRVLSNNTPFMFHDMREGMEADELTIFASRKGDVGYKPVKIVQLKPRMHRPIPYSKHRSKRILKKLMKRQELRSKPFVVSANHMFLNKIREFTSLPAEARVAHNFWLQAENSQKVLTPELMRIIDEGSYIKQSTWNIDFNDPWIYFWTPIFRFDATKKPFEEIERFDIRDQTKVNNHRVVILRDGEKIRYLKGEVYAKPHLHQSEVQTETEI